jgi:hypothetical protein
MVGIMLRTCAIALCLVLLTQGCASAGYGTRPTTPKLDSLYQTVPIFENALPQCGFDVIEPIGLEGPIDSEEVVQQVTARAMYLGGDALVLLPTFLPMEGTPGQSGHCSLAVIKFRKWTCQH